MSAGAVIIKRQNQIIRAFRDAGATFADNAKPLTDMHYRNSLIFRRLVSKGIIVKCDDEKYYLNNRAADAFLINRRRKVVITLLLVVVVLVVLASQVIR